MARFNIFLPPWTWSRPSIGRSGCFLNRELGSVSLCFEAVVLCVLWLGQYAELYISDATCHNS